MKKAFYYLIFFLIISSTQIVNAQTVMITGQAIGKSDGLSIPGVAVVLKENQTVGTVTNIDGKYSIEATPNSVLIFSFVGLTTLEVPVSGQTEINVVMESSSIEMDEVVAIGYGVQKKSLVTGSISSVTADDLKGSSITRAEQALQGKTAGVLVLPNSGSPGAGLKVRVRGISTNGNAEPLYIVDGMKTGNINHISPTDIEGIEVLKDAASSAIYGAEGGNGVVIITTKSGKAGESKLSYDVQYSWDKAGHLPELLNAEEFVNYYNEAGVTGPKLNGIDTDWLDAIFETGKSQQHNLSYRSGNENSKVLISGSYLDQDGIVFDDKDQYQRVSFRFNSDHQVKKWLKIGNKAAFSRSVQKSIPENSEFGGVLSGALMMDPLTPVIYTDPSQIPKSTKNLIKDHPNVKRDENGNIYGISPFVTGEIVNPFVALANETGKTKISNFLGNFWAEISPIKDLKFTTRYGVDLSYSVYHGWNPTYYYTGLKSNNLASVEEYSNNYLKWQWENFITYNKSFNDHRVGFVGGMSSEASTYRSTSVFGASMNVERESYSEFDYISTQDNDLIKGYTTEYKLMSYFARFTYDYKNKYLLQGSIRRDGASSSYLPKEGRWGAFPSFSAGWVISNEDFLTIPALSYLKLRGSWGKNGSLSNLGNYSYYGFLTSTDLSYPAADDTFVTPTEPSRLTNEDLTWETSEQTDLGIDLRAFDSRLSFSVDYYIKKTKDLLTPNTPPMETGNFAAFINAGDVENKGFEFDLGWRNSTKSGLNYSVNVNFATLDNKVTYLNPTISRLPGAQVNGNSWIATYVEEGMPIWYFRGYKTNGIDKATGEPIIEDINKDGSVSVEDYTYIGDPHPDFVFGGNIAMDYKNFDLGITFQGTKGNDIIMSYMRNDRPTINRMKIFYDDRWTPTNVDATMPKAGTKPVSWNSDLLVKDGSYLRIKQIQLGYTLPKSILNKIQLSNIRAYVTLENFFTFTKYPGIDPEVGGSTNDIGVDRGFYPISKKIILGASVTF